MTDNLKRGLSVGVILVALYLVVSCGRPVEVEYHEKIDKDADSSKTDKNKPAAGPGTYLFCFWNVENLFDDVDDGRKTKGDSEFDHYFGGGDGEALKHKLDHLADVLVKLNDGKGPDVLGLCEVESERAAQMLADVLNKRLGGQPYTVVFEKLSGVGRHIAPALLTRLPVVKDKTDVWGKRKRILETVVRVNDNDLMVVVSHWTSRLTDKKEKGDARAGYGDTSTASSRGRTWRRGSRARAWTS